MALPSNLAMHSMLPLEQKQPARTKGAVVDHTDSRIDLSSLTPTEQHKYLRTESTPAPQSSLDTLSLLPVKPDPSKARPAGVDSDAVNFPNRPLNAHKAYAHTAYLAQSSGEAVAHVTEGVHHPSAPPSAWRELRDAGGQSSHIAARNLVKGSLHFFGQDVWPSRDGLAPFHGPLVISERGLQQYEGHGHFDAAGSFSPTKQKEVEISDAEVEASPHSPPLTSGQLTPRHAERALRHIPNPEVPAEEPLTPGRVKQFAGKRHTFFDGAAAAAAIHGGPL